jgi:hypothetical protein
LPALPDVPNVLKVELGWSIGTDLDVVSRFHFRYTGTAPANAVCTTLAASIYGIAATTFIVAMASLNSLTSTKVTDLTSTTSGLGEHTAVTHGSQGFTPLPAEVCALMNINIARRYRGGKPRVYLPLGTYQDIVSPQLWATASLATFQSICGSFLSDVEALTDTGTAIGSLCSVSYYKGFTVFPDPIVPGIRSRNVSTLRGAPVVDSANSISVNPRPGSQRRRMGH